MVTDYNDLCEIYARLFFNFFALPLGIATIIIVISLLLLCGVCAFL